MITNLLVWAVIAVPATVILFKRRAKGVLSVIMFFTAVVLGMVAGNLVQGWVDSLLPTKTEVSSYPLVSIFEAPGQSVYVKDIEIGGATYYLYEAVENGVSMEKTVIVNGGLGNVWIKDEVANPRLEIASVRYERSWYVLFGRDEVWRQIDYVFYVPPGSTDLDNK
ncbi:hypothetical protein D4S03_05725 [bacterium]|nr:MAG: hypothetical protein D4S03_05725 [bacterium]